jgi:hypothetical protein
VRWFVALLAAALVSCAVVTQMKVISSDDPSADTGTVEAAVGRNDEVGLRRFLLDGQRPADPALMVLAARFSTPAIVELLIGVGASVDVRVFGRSETPLLAAASRDDDGTAAAILTLLLGAGADPCVRLSEHEPHPWRVTHPFRGMSATEIASALEYPLSIAVLENASGACGEARE